MADVFDGLNRPIPVEVRKHISRGRYCSDYILKFPPTKNLRPILTVVQLIWFVSGGLRIGLNRSIGLSSKSASLLCRFRSSKESKSTR